MLALSKALDQALKTGRSKKLGWKGLVADSAKDCIRRCDANRLVEGLSVYKDRGRAPPQENLRVQTPHSGRRIVREGRRRCKAGVIVKRHAELDRTWKGHWWGQTVHFGVRCHTNGWHSLDPEMTPHGVASKEVPPLHNDTSATCLWPRPRPNLKNSRWSNDPHYEICWKRDCMPKSHPQQVLPNT